MAKDDLKNLPPEERIKKLKELEKKRKKEIAEGKKEIQKSQDEISERNKWQEKVPIPEFAQEHLEGLSEEAKEMLKTSKGLKEKLVVKDEDTDTVKKEEVSLEEAVEKEQPDLPPEAMAAQYGAAGQPPGGDAYKSFHDMTMGELQQTVYQTSKAAEERGYITKQDSDIANYALGEVEKRLEDSERGEYSFTEETAKAASLTQSLGSQIANVYKSGKSMYEH